MFVVTVAMFMQTNIDQFFHCTKWKQLQTSCARESDMCSACHGSVPACITVHASFLNDVSVCKCVHAGAMNELLFPSRCACRCSSVCLCLLGKYIWQENITVDMNLMLRNCNVFLFNTQWVCFYFTVTVVVWVSHHLSFFLYQDWNRNLLILSKMIHPKRDYYDYRDGRPLMLDFKSCQIMRPPRMSNYFWELFLNLSKWPFFCTIL